MESLRSTRAMILPTLAVILVMLGCTTTGGQDQSVYYRVHVQPGETLVSIASKFNTDWQGIARENGIETPESLQAGQVLIVRPGIASEQSLAQAEMKASRPSPDGFLFKEANEKVHPGRLVMPVRGEISSRFGMRRGRMHHGTDFKAPRGTSIVAAADGRVSFSGWMRGYGKTVTLKHGNGSFSTLYAHCDQILVKKGDWVQTGQRIATVGATGNARGNHLHFEVRNRDGSALNPEHYLPATRRGIFASSEL